MADIVRLGVVVLAAGVLVAGLAYGDGSGAQTFYRESRAGPALRARVQQVVADHAASSRAASMRQGAVRRSLAASDTVDAADRHTAYYTRAKNVDVYRKRERDVTQFYERAADVTRRDSQATSDQAASSLSALGAARASKQNSLYNQVQGAVWSTGFADPTEDLHDADGASHNRYDGFVFVNAAQGCLPLTIGRAGPGSGPVRSVTCGESNQYT